MRTSSCGADDLAAASEYIMRQNGEETVAVRGVLGRMRAGCSRNGIRGRVKRLALDALV